MHGKNFYANGNRVWQQEGDILSYFFKTGTLKARGGFLAGQMQGEWRFWRDSGELWQIGNFRDGLKHGLWLRYDRGGVEEYRETFEMGKQLAKP